MTSAFPKPMIWLFLMFICPGLCAADTNARIKQAVNQWWDANPGATAVVVRLRDTIVYEGYRDGQNRDDLMPVFSVTKSIGSILTGIALHEGSLRSLDAPIVGFLPQVPQNMSPLKRSITVRNILMMSSGLNSSWSLEGRPIQAYRGDLDNAAFALEQKISPGETSRYSTLVANLLVPTLESAVGQELENYTAMRLFQPLEIHDWSWHTDDTGRKTLGSGLRLRTIDLTKIGQLLLNGGTHQGKRLLGKSYVKDATSSLVQIKLGDGGNTGYGYLFWQSSSFPHPHFIAAGYAGQMIFGVPDRDLVVAVSAPCCAATNTSSEGLVTNYIVPLLEN